MAAGRPVRLVTLNDATNLAGSWIPEAVSANALRAARDDSTVGYIGELNSGASMVSLPILNEAGIPMISPGNTYVGLTVKAPGSDSGEPEKYYPSGVRTYFRLQPNDTVQAAALRPRCVTAAARRSRPCTTARSTAAAWPHGAAELAPARPADRCRPPRQPPRPQLPRRSRIVRRAQADCMVYTGVTANGAVRLFRDVARAVRRRNCSAVTGSRSRASPIRARAACRPPSAGG